MALGVQERQVHLEGRVAEQAGKLGLGHDLGGHEVEQKNAQGAYVLRHGASFSDNEDIFAVQRFDGWQLIGNLDGHGRSIYGQK